MSIASSAALNIRAVTRAYPGLVALDAVSLALHSGRITCLLGPSGCGKSTLLRVLAGLEPIDAGEIEAGGRLLSAPGVTTSPETRGIGLVFQDFALFPHLTVAENVGFGLDHVDRRQRRAQVLELLDRFKLAHRADAWPHTLSGGEQQRVAIARALAREPAALLLDEPFSGLDGDLKAEVRALVLGSLRATSAAILMVTHDPEEAMLVADDLALMSEGRLLQTGTPGDCYLNPRSIAAARLLGPVGVVPATVARGVAKSPFGNLSTDLPDGPATLVLRPEALTLADTGAPVEIVEVRFLGACHEVRIAAEGICVVLRDSGPKAPPPGPAFVSLKPGVARLFAA